MEAKKLAPASLDEYLEIEKESQTKYEFHDGTIFAMAGNTLQHGLICDNIFGELRAALRARQETCRAITSEIKLYIESKNSFVYPDAMVVCGEIQSAQNNPHAIINPVVIVEVLSQTTSSYDRGDKFYLYRQIESLQEYVLIEQEKPQIEIYQRAADLWRISHIEGLDQKIPLNSLNIILNLNDIYQDVVFTSKNEL